MVIEPRLALDFWAVYIAEDNLELKTLQLHCLSAEIIGVYHRPRLPQFWRENPGPQA